MNSCNQTEKSCGCAEEKPDSNQPVASTPASGMTFKIEGLDCAEEVATLKSAIGPIVGGSDKLVFDILNGRMTLLPDAESVSEKTIIKAVAATGMKATRWQAGQAQADVKQLHRSKTVYTTLSGLFIIVGMLIHIAMAGGFTDAHTFLSHPENWSLQREVISQYLYSLFSAHAQQAMPLPEKIAFGLAVVLGARHVIVKAFYALRRLRADMNLLMTVAVIGAMFIDEWFEAATVSFLFSLSLAIESWSIGRARHAVEALLDLAPSTVTIKDETGKERVVPAAEISIGTHFILAPDDKIPLDGEVITGFSSVNQAPITGENIPVAKQVGDEVFAGSINGEGTLEIRSSKLATDTTLAQITRLVGEAHSKRAETEQWVEKFARVYTPVVMLLALAVFVVPPLFLEGLWDEWFYRALVLLVIACPCALVISTPVSIVAALASAARQGILIKGGIYIEAPAHLNAIAFDKTGTLTCGEPIVTGVYPFNSHSEEELLSRAAALEARSNHPLAKAILQYTENLGISVTSADNVTVLPGKGVTGLFNGTNYWLGSRRYLLERSQEVPEISEKAIALEQTGQTVIAIGSERHICGLIAVADQPRAQIKAILQSLRQKGIKHLVMLTGDNRVTANNIAAQIGIDEVHAELLPADKVEIVSQMVEKYGQVAMIGDGVNDAPALGRANLGIAMGVLGSDAAIEIADIALMGDDLSKLPWLIGHSKRTLAIIRQNITFALTIKAIFALLAFAGLATLWEAIAADMGASLLVVANGLRLLNVVTSNQIPTNQQSAQFSTGIKCK
jgi:Zn2+/Cd2+-exporting ATPase